MAWMTWCGRGVQPNGRARSPRSKLPGLLGLIAIACIAAAPATTAPSTRPTTRPVTLALDLGAGQTMELVRIPAGKFTMGSPATEAERDDSEGPQRPVHIDRPFFMGKYEVTQGQYVAVMGVNQSRFRGDDQLPAECVSWGDCQKFCDALSRKTGRKVRLPTEAEWEYAARAGTQSIFGTGDALSSAQANFNGENPYGGAAVGPNRDKTMPVGSFPPNAFGLYDMLGNVSDWCQDVYHDSYEGAPADGSAWETGADPEIRVHRGGAYNNDASSCRVAVRYAAERNNNRNPFIGLRVVVDEKDPPAGGGEHK